jgi:hypothetical protein
MTPGRVIEFNYLRGNSSLCSRNATDRARQAVDFCAQEAPELRPWTAAEDLRSPIEMLGDNDAEV